MVPDGQKVLQGFRDFAGHNTSVGIPPLVNQPGILSGGCHMTLHVTPIRLPNNQSSISCLLIT